MDNFLLTYDILEDDAFKENAYLKNVLVHLVGQSYLNPTDLIERVYSVNDIAFVAKLGADVVGILLFNYQKRCTVVLENQRFSAVYNGYAVTDLRYRNQRIIQNLISFATAEFNRRIEKTNSKLLLYAITSNPYALRAYRNVCEYMEPFSDGSFSERGSQLVSRLKNELGITVLEDAHPFKFTTSLPQRYSDFEQVNLDKAPEAEKLFLQRLGVIETMGDRVIFFWGPQHLLSNCAITKPSDEPYHLFPFGASDKTD
ncbi:hypothetical protein G8759_11415 [Spirosoma aureum]|uniref:GNAT family N-acetyltransferase n=1 Tax=Spirosoma aureum TaxID=2692134 RepID=A0A6G9ALI1_9BACT|nr:hypothetical protein [Spirosoma aureum]QIP13189.1 hypothetical protein G8759_11415 [Spirosoma aureum]